MSVRDTANGISIMLYGVIAVAVLVLTTPSVGDCEEYCFDQAGSVYGVSSQILWAISKQESRHIPNAINRNTNGTYDYCHMQINSSWHKYLGPDRWDALSDPCYCTMVGAWILSECVRKHGYTWQAVGCYHSPARGRGVSYANRISGIISKIDKNPTNKEIVSR